MTRTGPVELDELLHLEIPWERVVQAFKQDDTFPEEHYLTAAIRRHLLTEDQRRTLFEHGLDLADVLNGRYGDKSAEAVYALCRAWNEKLGFGCFGDGTWPPPPSSEPPVRTFPVDP
jgi:hypothetical protein